LKEKGCEAVTTFSSLPTGTPTSLSCGDRTLNFWNLVCAQCMHVSVSWIRGIKKTHHVGLPVEAAPCPALLRHPERIRRTRGSVLQVNRSPRRHMPCPLTPTSPLHLAAGRIYQAFFHGGSPPCLGGQHVCGRTLWLWPNKDTSRHCAACA